MFFYVLNWNLISQLEKVYICNHCNLKQITAVIILVNIEIILNTISFFFSIGSETAQSFLTSLLGGYKIYTDSSGNIITGNNIVAFLDMTDGNTAWAISPILSRLGIPEIRIMSTDSAFLNNAMYPLLVSAVPSQETVHLAIIQMLSSFKWSYIQVMFVACRCFFLSCAIWQLYRNSCISR